MKTISESVLRDMLTRAYYRTDLIQAEEASVEFVLKMKDTGIIDKSVSITFYETGKNIPHTWCGEQFHFPLDITIDKLFHEYAHYVLADETMRKQPDFGLGEGFLSDSHTECTVGEHIAQQHEELACVLEWHYLYHNGHKENISYAMYDENFGNETKIANRSIELLKKKGILK